METGNHLCLAVIKKFMLKYLLTAWTELSVCTPYLTVFEEILIVKGNCLSKAFLMQYHLVMYLFYMKPQFQFFKSYYLPNCFHFMSIMLSKQILISAANEMLGRETLISFFSADRTGQNSRSVVGTVISQQQGHEVESTGASLCGVCMFA